WNLLMKGLAAVLPIGLTLYIVYWLGSSAEVLMRDVITRVLPRIHYWPGMGILVGFVLLIAAGLVVNAYVVRWAMRYWESLFERIPLVKTIYGGIRDLMKFLPGDG